MKTLLIADIVICASNLVILVCAVIAGIRAERRRVQTFDAYERCFEEPDSPLLPDVLRKALLKKLNAECAEAAEREMFALAEGKRLQRTPEEWR